MSNIKNKHYMWGTPEYRAWKHMKGRCYTKNDKKYKNYGGRGIKVCDRWLNSFHHFHEDMGNKPEPKNKYSLDRINVNGDYCKENCRWATIKQQANNKTVNHNLTFNGKTQNIKQWSEELGIPHARIRRRLDLGWSTEQALSLNKKINQYG